MVRSSGSTDDPRLSKDALVRNPEATTTRAIPLLLGTCLPVLSVVLPAPLLPAMQGHFANTPSASVMAPLAIATPSLMVVLTAPFVGLFLDVTGRRYLLIGAVVGYAGVGVAPLWLDSLGSIVFSRMLLGIAAAVAIVSTTTYLCDNYRGVQRDRLLGIQAVVANVAAMAAFALSGALGAVHWRLPFATYAAALLLVPSLLRTLPVRRAIVASRLARSDRRRHPLPWRRLLPRCAVTCLTALMFNAPVTQTAHLMNRFDVSSAATIGIVAALTTVATVVGAVVFVELSMTSSKRLLTGGFSTTAVGFVIIAFAALSPTQVGGPITVCGLVVACLGCGVLLPATLTWTLRLLDEGQFGRGAGMFSASFYLGQFSCPLVIMALSGVTGGMLPTFGVLASACVIIAIGIAASRLAYRGVRREPPSLPEALSLDRRTTTAPRSASTPDSGTMA